MNRTLPFLLVSLSGFAVRADTIPLSSLDLSPAHQGWGMPRANRSVDDHQFSIGSQKFDDGFGTHTPGILFVNLQKTVTRFTAKVGIDDEIGPGSSSIEFVVYGDGKVLWRSGRMKSGDAAKPINIDLTGVDKLALRVTDAGDGNVNDHADWVNAAFTYSGTAPVTYSPSVGKAVVLTPPAKLTPRINGASLFGVRPNSPFLYSIAATGDRPMAFSAKGLPKGLTLDTRTGRITGRLAQTGIYNVRLGAKNALGVAQRSLQIVVGDKIQLTPPMGYNSWNCWGPRVDQDKMMRSARAMLANKLDQHGWNYVNIDDAWQGLRGGPLNAVQPNEKFPDIRGFVDELHRMGFKAGIYSSPWTTTYDNHQGSSSNDEAGSWDRARSTLGRYSFAANDARQWALWSIDYLKYDWYPNSARETREMHDALKATGRDIVLSLSNNTSVNDIGNLAPHTELWRTTSDISDTWESMSGIGFSQDVWSPWHRAGNVGDPDMLVVGQVFGWEGNPHPTRLTPDEQYTHISLWSLLGAPLLIGCDMEKLDAFTLGLITNDEVIAIDQDALNKQATCAWKGGEENELNVYSKPLADGSLAVGLFNRGPIPTSIPVLWQSLGLRKPQVVRDVWRQKDVGKFNGKFATVVPSHGVMFFKLSPA